MQYKQMPRIRTILTKLARLSLHTLHIETTGACFGTGCGGGIKVDKKDYNSRACNQSDLLRSFIFFGTYEHILDSAKQCGIDLQHTIPKRPQQCQSIALEIF